MVTTLSLAPRYRLDDESAWLVGIDPLRRYWLDINGDPAYRTYIVGLPALSKPELRPLIMAYRDLQPGECLTFKNSSPTALALHCVSPNCFAIETYFQQAAIWHLFDQESLESLLMTAHPDWQCAPEHLELSQQLLQRSLSAAIATDPSSARTA
ncbi:MAG: hypothetical protein AAGF24_07425 [Cyanobacteria bacterium P01_H01_bin.121]